MLSNYRFPATVKRHGLATRNAKDEGGEPYKVPVVTIVLEYEGSQARDINAWLSAFQGEEVLLDLEGSGVQLNLA